MEASAQPTVEQKDPVSPVKSAKEDEVKSPQKLAKEEEQPAAEPLEPESMEEIEKKERFQELQTFLKKFNKRVPDSILVRDFEKILWMRGQDPTKKEVEDYIKQYAKYDRDPDGLIENKALFDILEERAKAPDTPEELKKALLTLADSEGNLLKEELRFHLRTMGEPLEEKEVKKLLEVGSDPNDTKYVNIDLFVEKIFKGKVVKTK